jgi:ribonuclease R
MRALGAERFRHDQKRHALIGEHTRTSYRLGEIIPVRLAEAAPLTGGLRFELIGGNEAAMSAASKPARKSRSRSKTKKSQQNSSKTNNS